MKKRFAVTLILILAVSLSVILASCGGGGSGTTDVLYVYNWGDYIAPEIEADFEAWYKTRTGKSIDMIYSTYDTNEVMLTNVLKGKSQVDLVCPSEYAIQKLLKEDLLEKLDFSKIPTYGNVNADIMTKVDGVFADVEIGATEKGKMSDYFVPYMWGTLGVLYNKNIVSREDAERAGYGLLWNSLKIDKLDGKVYMKDAVRDAYAAVVLYLKETGKLPAAYAGYSPEVLMNTVTADLLAAAEEALKAQKDCLKDYEVDFGKNEMVSEKGYVSLAWSGDALYAMEDADYLDYYVPAVGGNVWFDGWAMLKNAQNKEAAYLFIEYMCRPEKGLENSLEIGYTSALSKESIKASAAAIALLNESGYTEKEFFDNEIRYPDINNATFGVMRDFGAQNSEVVAMWERVKAYGNKTWVLIIVIVGVAVVIAAVAVVIILKNKKGGKRRVISRPVSKPVPATITDDMKEELNENKKDEE